MPLSLIFGQKVIRIEGPSIGTPDILIAMSVKNVYHQSHALGNVETVGKANVLGCLPY